MRIPKYLMVGLLAAAAGCTSYYKVTDPHSGRVYYTDKLKEEQGGAVELKDAHTGVQVTLQNSSVMKVNKETFEANKDTSGTIPTAPTTPTK